MSIDPYEMTAMSLAGTVALPCPPASQGSIEILPPADPAGATYLRITQRINLKLIVRRIVNLTDVVLIQASPEDFPGGDAGGAGCADPSVFIPLVQNLIAQSDSTGVIPWIARGVVYVPEETRLLMQVELGLTARESAEYYPPMAFGGECGEQPTSCHPNFGQMWMCHPW